MYTVHCTLYRVRHTVYSIHCTNTTPYYTTVIHSAMCTVLEVITLYAYIAVAYSIHYIVYDVHCTVHVKQCSLYTVRCTLYTVHYTLYTTLHTSAHTRNHTHCGFYMELFWNDPANAVYVLYRYWRGPTPLSMYVLYRCLRYAYDIRKECEEVCVSACVCVYPLMCGCACVRTCVRGYSRMCVYLCTFIRAHEYMYV